MTLRVVVDTNIVISAILRDRNPELVLRVIGRRNFALLTSPALSAEVWRVLNYPKFRRYFPANDRTVQDAYAQYLAVAEMVPAPVQFSVPELRDANDQMVIACAMYGSAQVIVSGDGDLIALNGYRGLEIVSAAQFLARYGLSDESLTT